MEKHDHRHKEELLQQMRRQAEIRPEQNDSEPAASSDTGSAAGRMENILSTVPVPTERFEP